MYSYSGTPLCARCSKAVYAAEQAIGPGRKVYHKPCLNCTSCGTRLDSYKLVEHDREPYCKPCHIKNFGTVDLRHANLPTSSPEAPRQSDAVKIDDSEEGGCILESDSEDDISVISPSFHHVGMRFSNLPEGSLQNGDRIISSHNTNVSSAMKPVSPVSTGSSNSPTRWRPSQQTICPACQKVVYFAEQVKASGHTWHKLCLKCTECKTRLDSSRLTEKDGVVYCRNCYGKIHGPQGGGYALAGRRMG